MRRFVLLSTALLAAASCLSPAAAEDEIVVTATRTPTAQSRLPARVETIDRTEIEARSLISLTEAIGAQAVQSGGAGQQASVFLRGANSKHVLALFDGVRINDASNPNAQYDFGLDTLGGVERVEILRGPASSIYGSDAIGGAVNVIPRRGGGDGFEPFAEIAGGSFETWRGLLGAAGTQNGFEYGVSAESYDSAGFDGVPERMTTRTGDPDGAHIDTLTASARYNAGAFGLDALLHARASETEFDTFSGGVNFNLRADDPDLKNETSQSLWRLGGDFQANEALMLRLSGGQVSSDRAEVDGGFETSSAESMQTFADLNARYTNGASTLTAGLAFERADIDTRPQFADPLRVAEDQRAAYVVGQTRFGERLDATASVRIDDYESFGTQTTYAVGLVVDLSPVRVFGSYGTAFKAPSLSERFETSFFNVGNPDLKPEESRSWEIGADWRAGEMLTLGGSYYQTRIRGLIEYDFGQLRNVNVDRAAIDGAELYAEAAPVSWGSVRVSYAWTDARDDVTGGQLLRRPEQSWRIAAHARPTERLGLALTWDFVGERTDVTYDDAGMFVSGSGRVPSYNVATLAATFHLTDRAELFVRVDDLTDETYEQPAAFAGAPRGVTAGVRATF